MFFNLEFSIELKGFFPIFFKFPEIYELVPSLNLVFQINIE